MELRFSPLFSGSSGNCVYVGCDEGGFLIDAGVSGKRILTAMDEMGIDPKSIFGILVTHEHTDHVAGVGVMARKLNVPVYATEGTWIGHGRGRGQD
jgi:Metal-dependent hydrolases of the beta-lactamase superfamily I